MDPIRRTCLLGQRYLDGLTTAAEFAELEKLLQGDPVAADTFARLSRLDADLSAQFYEEPLRLREAAVLHAIERDRRRRRWWGHGLRLAVAASLLLLSSGSLSWWLGQPQPVVTQQIGNVVLEGEVLVEGQSVEHLDDGQALMVAGPAPALLQLSDGSQARLEPASEAVVHGASEGVAQRFELIEGAAQFVVHRAREPFLVDTPAGSVRAEDSEFKVRLTKSEPGDPQLKMKQSLLAVMVVSGLARVETDNTYRLEAGEKRVFAFQRDATGPKPVWFVVDPGADGRATEQREGIRARLPGLIVGVVSDAKDNKLTIAFGRRTNPTQETFDVGAAVKVLVDGKPGKVTDLVKGTLVRIEKNDEGDLVAVVTEGQTVSGRVKLVSPGKITLQGRGRAQAGETDTEYTVPAEAKVFIDRLPGKLTDLKPGQGVILKLSMDRKSVLSVTSMWLRQELPVAAFGEIKSIDEKAGTITLSEVRGIQDRTPTAIKERTLVLPKDVRVVIDGQPAKLGDLASGKRVVLRLDREGKTVQAINVLVARRPLGVLQTGVISEIKDGKLTLSLRGRDAATGEKTFDVGESARVFVDNKPAKLTDLAKGMTVQLGLDEKGTLVTIRVEGPSVGGRLKEITAEKITLQGRGEDSSYILSPKVIVIIDRKPAKLADIKVGMEVMLKLSADGKTVLTIAMREGWPPFVSGVVKSIDVNANTITVATMTGRPAVRQGEVRTFSLGKQVRVSMDGQPGDMANVRPGSEVIVAVDRDGKTVVRIAVQSGVRGVRRREGQR
jgi:ferric-dicitrate binding protein FerR (iron transport regulator)